MDIQEKENQLKVGDKIHCKDIRELRWFALSLSSEGYGVAVIGCDDIYESILTITALPEEDT